MVCVCKKCKLGHSLIFVLNCIKCYHLSAIASQFLVVLNCIKCYHLSAIASQFLVVLNCIKCYHLSAIASRFLVVLNCIKCYHLSAIASRFLVDIAFLSASTQQVYNLSLVYKASLFICAKISTFYHLDWLFGLISLTLFSSLPLCNSHAKCINCVIKFL